jgi:hypothetical protein
MPRRFINIPNGERELVLRRYKIPGQHQGFVSVCASGNCYQTFRGAAFWLCELPAGHHTRGSIMELCLQEKVKREAEALAGAIAPRMRILRGGE